MDQERTNDQAQVQEAAGPRPKREKGVFAIIGMGGSAGGLEAFEQFFSHLPPDTGLAFVLVPHLEPTHKGMMPELLARHTKMTVVEAEDGMEVRPNHVYVIPPNQGTADRRDQLLPRSGTVRLSPRRRRFRGLLRDRAQGGPLRVWNPGCSTGKETYSLVIVLKEYLEVAGSDGNHTERSRSLPPTSTTTPSRRPARARLRRHRGGPVAPAAGAVLPPRGRGLPHRKEIRDLVIFALQNILVDPPFTKLDILCCRNLLIYINVPTQVKLLPLMHYAINPGGLLVLGTAESIGGTGTCLRPWTPNGRFFNAAKWAAGLLEMPAYVLRHGTATPVAERSKEPVMDIFYATRACCWMRTARPP